MLAVSSIDPGREQPRTCPTRILVQLQGLHAIESDDVVVQVHELDSNLVKNVIQGLKGLK